MCVGVIGLAVTAASAVMSYQQQQKQAAAQQQAGEQQAKLQSQAYVAETQALQERYNEINKNASDQMSERAREARVESARLRAIGAESGLAGTSLDKIENESDFLRGTDMATIESNRAAHLRQTVRDGAANSLSYSAKSAAINYGPGKPSLIGPALQIAGAGVDAYRKSKATT